MNYNSLIFSLFCANREPFTVNRGPIALSLTAMEEFFKHRYVTIY